MTTRVATVGNQYVTGWGGGRKKEMGVGGVGGVGGNGWFVRGVILGFFWVGGGWVVARWGAIKGCRFVRAEKSGYKAVFCSVFSKSTNSSSSFVSEFSLCFPFPIFFSFFSSS